MIFTVIFFQVRFFDQFNRTRAAPLFVGHNTRNVVLKPTFSTHAPQKRKKKKTESESNNTIAENLDTSNSEKKKKKKTSYQFNGTK